MRSKLKIGVLLICLVVIGFSITFAFANSVEKYKEGTSISGVDISNLSLEEAKTKLYDTIDSRVVNIKFGDELYSIKFNKVTDNAKSSVAEVLSDETLGNVEYRLNDNNIIDFIENTLKSEEIKPKDAYIKYDKKAENYIIKNEIYGNNFTISEVLNRIKESIIGVSLGKDIIVDITDLGIEPKIKSDDKELVKSLNKLNKFISKDLKINVDKGKKSEQLSFSEFRKYCSINKTKVSIDYSFLDEFVNKLATKYNTVGSVRKFKKHNGKVIKIGGGIYGWQIDTQKTKKNIIKALNKDKEKCDIEWAQKANGWGKNEIGKTYIEVSLKEQHLYYFKNGKLKLESPIVSGLDSSAERRTNTGVGMVFARRWHTRLKGATWNTYVNCFMPFNYNGQGLHDATWRSSFGGNIYKYSGSHGCVNMPLSKALKLYKMTDNGIPVVVY